VTRGERARAIARFIPDCAVLFARLARDRRVRRRHRLLVAALGAYLASPIDLVPDFIPVAGYLDDAVIVALVLRAVVRGSGREVVRDHWPGPSGSLEVVLRLTAVERPASARAS
jgi:uncharacterized membrane protein YkvA (DUF1232 family)